MSKNLTRKGLALGAIVALSSTLFAGTAAQAAGELNVVPSSGTSYNAVAGSVFNLSTTFAPGYTPSSYAQLKYIVKTDANAGVTYGVGVAAVTAPATSQAVSLSSSAVAATGAGATTVNYIGLKTNDTAVSSSVEVTAFVDANNDGAVTAGEWNTVKTVNFKKLADLAPVVTLAQPSTGDTTVSATVAWGDVNVEQASNTSTYLVASGSTNSALAVEFNIAGAGYPAGDLATAGASGVTYASATGKFSKTVSALASAATVAVRAVWSTNTFAAGPVNTYSSTLLGSAASAAATARTINTTNGLVANLVTGNDAKTATPATTIALNTAAVVRTNGTYVAQVKAYDTTAGTALAAKSVAVVGSVTATTTATDLRPASTGVTEISVTVNGTKYTSETALNAATVALTTDADGLASFTISSVGLVATDALTIAFKAQNLTSSILATQTDATYTVTDDMASAVVATNKNTATTFNYSVKDQWGVLSARTNERLVVTATTAATVTQYIAVTGGKASFTVTPVTDSTADITVAAALEVSTNTNGSISWAANGTNVGNRTVKIRAAAYTMDTAPAVAFVWDASLQTPASAAYNATSNYKQPLTTAALADLAAVSGTTAANATWQTVTLTGSNAGEKLTVSGTGVFISIDGATATADTATKVAQAAAVTIYVASNTTGAKTLTVTNGLVTKTVVVTFDKAAATAGKTVSIGTLDAQAQAGRAVEVSAVLVDKFGNPVQGATVTLTATGVGYLANNSVVTSDAAGKVTAKLVVGPADLGSATISASSTLADATVATATKTIEFGVTDVTDISSAGKAIYVNTEFAKGKVVTVYIDGKRMPVKSMEATDNAVERKYTQKTAGKHVVTVRISGGVVASETVVTTK